MNPKLTGTFVDSIIETSQDAFIAVGTNGRVTHWNRQAESIFGWSRVEAIGKSLNELHIPLVLREAHLQGMAHHQATNEGTVVARRVQMQAMRRSGEQFPIEMIVSIFQEGDDQIFFAFLHDLTQRHKTENELLELALTDSLTELPNRRHLHRHLQESMARVDRTKRLMAILFMDIDHFKSINDQLGHDVGDQVLSQFATRLRASVRKVDFIGRLGGDEFMVLVEELANEENAIAVAQKIIDNMAPDFQVTAQPFYVTTSIGIALYNGGEFSPDSLIKSADQAMYQAKRSGRNTFRVAQQNEKLTLPPKSAPTPIAKLMAKSADSDDANAFMKDSLQSIRTHLGMDVAFISQFKNGERVFRFVDAESPNPPIAVGGSDPLEDSFCQRVVDGRLPELMPDAFLNNHAASLPVTHALPVRAHLSVPIRLKSGRIYGTYCCFSYTADQSLNERDLNMVKVFADLAARQLEREPLYD